MSDDEGGDAGNDFEEAFEEELEEEIEEDKEEILNETEAPFVENQNRITTKFMTKYEKARVLGTRAIQISMNAPIMVELEGEVDPLEIAQKELREKKIPFFIRRYLPDGSSEDWRIEELIID
eukprot:TRINITY_DN1261_c0_g1_i3.p2 TRINITY_DN1261_c0_g1~~TRINITY_DN1261_c0_g1_i3.p2  ORF type:complete len:141 (+),score=52.30 TRINITY_DN1261_c0_g1_i3:58-423(+)